MNPQWLPQNAPLAHENTERLLDPNSYLAEKEVEGIFIFEQVFSRVRSQKVVAKWISCISEHVESWGEILH